MDFVVAMGKAAVGSQSGLHTFPLFLADKGRNLRHQDPLFSGHVDTAETGVFARRGSRAAFIEPRRRQRLPYTRPMYAGFVSNPRMLARFQRSSPWAVRSPHS